MTTAPTTPLVLHLAGSAGDGTPLPLGLAGLPTEIEGKPVFYRRKELCHVVCEPHRGIRDKDGRPVMVDIPTTRLDAWASTFRQRAAKGIKPFLYPYHLDLAGGETADARKTLGYLIDAERNGDKLYGTLQLIGDEALSCAAANDVSVTVTADALNDEFLHHIAFTPMPQVTGMDGYTAVAASADGRRVAIPVLVLTSQNNPAGAEPATERSIVMKPETIQKLRAKLNLPDAKAVPDEDVAERAAAMALSDPPADKAAEGAALSADVTRLKGELDAANGKVLSLSATAPKSPDAVTLAMYQDNINAKREAAVRSGAVSEAEAKEFDKLIADAQGQPTPLALSASTGGRPLAFALWDTVAKLSGNGIRTGNAVTRTGGDATLQLSADAGQDAATVRSEAQAAAMAWQKQQLAARGMQPA